MLAVRHLRNAPITEAIVDFRVKARPDCKAEDFAKLREQLVDQFPQVDEQRGFQAVFGFREAGRPAPSTKDLGLRGLFFKSKDRLNIAQFRIDGFTYNRLKPYTSWEEIFPKALELWRLYARTALPSHVTRLALRYINHIDLPDELRRTEEVMKAPPPIPEELPLFASNFVTRLTVHDPDAHVASHITQAFERNPNRQNAILLLDIDAFYQEDLDMSDEQTESQISEIFGKLHDFKNQIFFASLTEQVIRSFE